MAQQYVYGLVLLFYGCLSILISKHVYNRKALQPLKSRQPHLLLMSQIGAVLVVTLISFREVDVKNFPCSLYVWMSNMFLPLFFLPYLIRLFRMIFIMRWAMARAYSDDFGEAYYKRRKWIGNTTLGFIMLGLFIFQMALSFFMDINIELLERSYEGGDVVRGCTFDYQFVPFLVEVVVYMILFVIAFLNLRGLPGFFGIQRELIACMVIWVVCGGFFFVFNMMPVISWLNEYVATSLWIVLMVFLSMVVSLIIPLIKTYVEDDNKAVQNYKNDVAQKYKSLEFYLKDDNESARKYLMNYFVEKDTPEYFRFLLRVKEYTEMQEEAKSQEAHFIVQTYLTPKYTNYLKEVCVDSDLNKIQAVITSSQSTNIYSSSIFNTVYVKTIDYLEKKYMQNFIGSTFYKNMCKDLTDTEDLIEEFTDNNLV